MVAIEPESGDVLAFVSMPTFDPNLFVDGIAVRGKALFRAYDSVAESVRDYVKLVKGSERYQAALQAGSDAYGYAAALARAGYATDPGYAAKFHAVLDSPLLQGLVQ